MIKKKKFGTRVFFKQFLLQFFYTMSNFTATLYVLCKIVRDLRWNLNILQANKYTIPNLHRFAYFHWHTYSFHNYWTIVFSPSNHPFYANREMPESFFNYSPQRKSSSVICWCCSSIDWLGLFTFSLNASSQSKLLEMKLFKLELFKLLWHCILWYVSLGKGNLDLSYLTIPLGTVQI